MPTFGENRRPDLCGVVLHLPPGQWWTPDGWLHVEIEEVADASSPAPEGWVWVLGHLMVDGEPVDWCMVPVRADSLPTPPVPAAEVAS